jgi:hypothetical protein
MGSFIEINDTLQITKEQGFPKELVIDRHLQNPYFLENFKDIVFEFSNKPAIRLYKAPPVRNFLVENINGKWIYWGLCHVIETTCDYIDKTTSGKFKIIYINTPEKMKKVHELIDRNPDTNYFV